MRRGWLARAAMEPPLSSLRAPHLRLGRYNKKDTSFNKNYNTDLPMRALLAAAGFNPTNPRAYDIPRAYHDAELCEGGKYGPLLLLVMPHLAADIEEAKVRGRAATRDTTDVTLKYFLQYLVQLRIVFLQDAAVTQDRFPRLCMFDHVVFQHPLWQEFKERVLERVESAGSGRCAAAVERVVDPAVREVLSMLSASLRELVGDRAESRKQAASAAGYLAKLAGNAEEHVKVVEVVRQSSALALTAVQRSLAGGAKADEGMQEILGRAALDSVSPLRARAFPGPASPGLGRGVVVRPRTLAREYRVLSAAAEAPAAEAPPGAEGCAGPSPPAKLKECKTLESLLRVLVQLHALRSVGGWKAVQQYEPKGYVSKWNCFFQKYKARDRH